MSTLTADAFTTADASTARDGAPSSPSVMAPRARRLIGTANVLLGVVALVALIAAYGLAERLVLAQEAAAEEGGLATRTVTWWGPDITVTLAMSLILVGATAGVAGSVVQQSLLFASRAGLETLERGYVWWYVLRPVWSALLGAVVVITANAGLVSIGDDTTSSSGVTVLVTAGALAGLFTDQVLLRLQTLLGATDPHRVTVTRDGMAAATTPSASS